MGGQSISDQDKREKVIKGMEYCINYAQRVKDLINDVPCEGCPYVALKSIAVGQGDCIDSLFKDVLALLKAQEPRVMTLDEVKMLNSDYYYLESMRSPGKELREIVGAYRLECVTWPSITWARQTMGDSGYGKTWRCWTSRPTEAEREAVKWE